MNLLIALQATQGKFPNLTFCPDYRSRSFFGKVRGDVRLCRFDYLPLLKKVATRGYLFLQAGADTIDYLFKFVTIFYYNAKIKLHFADAT